VSRPRLSICIPVYNFGPFLGPTLESIVGQADDRVEIVVLDGGSTDDTPQIIDRFQRRFPRLRYERRDRRGGIDRDMARAIDLATGDFCWTFSGDDIMRPGAVPRLLAELDDGVDVYLLESVLCRFDMTPLGPHRMLDYGTPHTVRLHDPAERIGYFRAARNTAAFFSFCSAVVFRKERWDSVPADESFMGSCWAHAARLFQLLPGGLTVRYLPDPFLDKRGDNDSFVTNGLVPRFGIAVDGYHRIADTFFGPESEEAFHVRRCVRAEQPWHLWLYAKWDLAASRRTDQRALFERLVRKQYSDPLLSNRVAVAVCTYTPASVLVLLKRALDGYRSVLNRAAGAPRRAGGAPPGHPAGEQFRGDGRP
jgi:abequosyltransferase